MFGSSYGLPNASPAPVEPMPPVRYSLPPTVLVPDLLERLHVRHVAGQGGHVGHPCVHVHRAHGVAHRLGLFHGAHLCLVVLEPEAVGLRSWCRPALVDQELRQGQVTLVAGDPVQADEPHLGHLVSRPDRRLAGSERAVEQVGAAHGHVEQRPLARGLVVRSRRLEQVSEVVQLVAVVALELPPHLAGPWMRCGGVDRPRRIEIAVGFLGGRNGRDQLVDVGIELRVRVHAEGVRRAFDDLVQIRVVERVAWRFRVRRAARPSAPAPHAGSCPTRPVSSHCCKRGRDRGRPVGLDPWCPELVVQRHGRERHRLDGVVARRRCRRCLSGSDVSRAGEQSTARRAGNQDDSEQGEARRGRRHLNSGLVSA